MRPMVIKKAEGRSRSRIIPLLVLASMLICSCGSTVWFSPSASDQQEASYVGGVVDRAIEKFIPHQKPPRSVYAVRMRTLIEVTVYGVTAMDQIEAICDDLSKSKRVDRPLSTRTVSILFYERERFVTTAYLPDGHGGTVPFMERKDEVLIASRTISLPE